MKEPNKCFGIKQAQHDFIVSYNCSVRELLSSVRRTHIKIFILRIGDKIHNRPSSVFSKRGRKSMNTIVTIYFTRSDEKSHRALKNDPNTSQMEKVTCWNIPSAH